MKCRQHSVDGLGAANDVDKRSKETVNSHTYKMKPDIKNDDFKMTIFTKTLNLKKS